MNFRVRDVESDEPDDTTLVEAFDAETAASKIVEQWFSEREYYRHVNDGDPIRIGVREVIFEHDGPEQIYQVRIELCPSAYANAEVFDHPTKPAPCYQCGGPRDRHGSPWCAPACHEAWAADADAKVALDRASRARRSAT